MSEHRAVIMAEFNELTPSLMYQFMQEGKLPNFKRLHNESTVYITDAEESVEDLEPWVQWVTIHTGLKAVEHGISELGEAHKLKARGLTELLSAAGRRVWICGSMNVRYDDALQGAVLPDPWTTTVEPHPSTLLPYYRFIQKNVQEHTNLSGTFGAAEYLSFLKFMVTHGLSFQTTSAIAKQLLRERTGRYRWQRVAVLDRLQWDTFYWYYKRIRPHFSTFFLNSTAHLQHRFWRNMEPGPFSVKPTPEEQDEFRGALQYGYEQMDALIGRFLKLAGDHVTLIFCTALGQQPCLKYEETGGKVFHRLRDVDRFLAFSGLRAPYTYVPAMSEEFHLQFESSDTAQEAYRRLMALRVQEQPAMQGHVEGTSFFGGCAIFSKMPNDMILTNPEQRSKARFFEFFYQADSLKSGMHHPEGMLWIRRPDKKHHVAKDKLALTAIAPTILKMLGVAPPETMASRSIAASG